MDKQFWASIASNDYQAPNGYTHAELTQVLFTYLSSTDPELRDEIAYIFYANWLKQEIYSKEEIHDHVEQLLANLEQGIGETESDSVFLRAFSVLLLAEIVHNDNKKPLLKAQQVEQILTKGLWYLGGEKDPRGHVRVKGWAHALAHTADLMGVLGRNRHLNKEHLQKILDDIAAKIIGTTDSIYVHGEDERLASAVVEILRRNLLSTADVEAWTKCLTSPENQDWKGAYVDEERNRAFQNTRNLLRSIHLELLTSEDEIASWQPLRDIFLKALKEFRP